MPNTEKPDTRIPTEEELGEKIIALAGKIIALEDAAFNSGRCHERGASVRVAENDRAIARDSLIAAVRALQAEVARLSTPVTTEGGEYAARLPPRRGHSSLPRRLRRCLSGTRPSQHACGGGRFAARVGG